MKASLEDTTLRLSSTGDILSTNVAAIRPLMLTLLSDHPDATSVVLDLEASRVIDSQGLNLLIALYRECERRSLPFRVVNPSPDIQRLFSFLNLTERFGLSTK